MESLGDRGKDLSDRFRFLLIFLANRSENIPVKSDAPRRMKSSWHHPRTTCPTVACF